MNQSLFSRKPRLSPPVSEDLSIAGASLPEIKPSAEDQLIAARQAGDFTVKPPLKPGPITELKVGVKMPRV